jgi:hypothetical protein
MKTGTASLQWEKVHVFISRSWLCLPHSPRLVSSTFSGLEDEDFHAARSQPFRDRNSR